MTSPNLENISSAIRNSFGRGRVLVVGDVMLDCYLWGTADRISPEAPTPVVRLRRESFRAGGAGNVALNLAGLGLHVSLAGFVGDDPNRNRLQEIFARNDIDTSAIVTLTDRQTATKTRVIAGHQHVLRLDAEDLSDIPDDDREEMFKALMSNFEVDAIILSDYAKGALPVSTCQQIIAAARERSVPVLVNPKGTDFSKYSGASVLIPNSSELAIASGAQASDIEGLVGVARRFVDTLQLEFLVLTRGAEGTTLVTSDQTVHSPARAREVFDVSGAGDTVIASVAAAMLARLNYVDMLHTVNLAAGVVVSRIGTAAINQTSLLRALQVDGDISIGAVGSLEDLLPLVEQWRSREHRIVFAVGCFDGLHAGHVSFLQKAAGEGDKLIVGICTDQSPNSAAGSQASGSGQDSRATVVAALGSVDAAIVCDSRATHELIKAMKPDVFVKGAGASDLTAGDIDEVESYGGRIAVLPLIDSEIDAQPAHRNSDR